MRPDLQAYRLLQPISWYRAPAPLAFLAWCIGVRSMLRMQQRCKRAATAQHRCQSSFANLLCTNSRHTHASGSQAATEPVLRKSFTRWKLMILPSCQRGGCPSESSHAVRDTSTMSSP